MGSTPSPTATLTYKDIIMAKAKLYDLEEYRNEKELQKINATADNVFDTLLESIATGDLEMVDEDEGNSVADFIQILKSELAYLMLEGELHRYRVKMNEEDGIINVILYPTRPVEDIKIEMKLAGDENYE